MYWLVDTLPNIHVCIREWRLSTIEQTERRMEQVAKKFRIKLNKRNRDHRKCIERVAHHRTRMEGMEDPTKGFGKSVGNRDTRNVWHNNP